MIYITPYHAASRQPAGPSQPLPCETLVGAEKLMGTPTKRYAAMLIYQGEPAYAVSRCRICIDEVSNSGQTTSEIDQTGSNDQ